MRLYIELYSTHVIFRSENLIKHSQGWSQGQVPPYS